MSGYDQPCYPNPYLNPNPNPSSTQTSSGGLAMSRTGGRPAGSKNKSKQPIVVTRDTHNALRSHILEVSSGSDIMDSLSSYARQRGTGLSVISANGIVMDVALRDPTDTSSIVTLHGRFETLSLIGTVLPPPAPPGAGWLSIFLSVGQGHIVGGSVIGPLMASGPVLLMATSFSTAVFERLPLPLKDPSETNAATAREGTDANYPFAGVGGTDHYGLLGWSESARCPPFLL
ncbi:AT-hook motif nuclear-localized protein 29-like [Amaranthus tricolor]|uniref:AT-hook motif nuclear-localized protein 29-like n=1 Tax=Amaranthus tricolor TaxID=29722 RepID=UPI0025835053|nr:AT-hook motif nuclear-localized protein 29-like [Amaranthus tricolor]